MLYCLSTDQSLYEGAALADDLQCRWPTNDKGKASVQRYDADADKAMYKTIAGRFRGIHTRIIGLTQRDVRQYYLKWRFKQARLQRRAATFRQRPIAFDSHNAAFSVSDDGDITLRVSLLVRDFDDVLDADGKPLRRLHLALLTGPLPPDQKDALRRYAEDGQPPAMKLIRGRRKYNVLIPYDRDVRTVQVVPERQLWVTPPPAARAEPTFCVATYRPGRGQPRTLAIEAASIEHWLRTTRLRRNNIAHKHRLSRLGADGPRGAAGHGLKRALRDREKHAARRVNFCRTRNQCMAAAIIKFAAQQRCGTVLHAAFDQHKMDPAYKTIDSWPYFQFIECLKNKSAECGIVCRHFEAEELKEFSDGQGKKEKGEAHEKVR